MVTRFLYVEVYSKLIDRWIYPRDPDATRLRIAQRLVPAVCIHSLLVETDERNPQFKVVPGYRSFSSSHVYAIDCLLR